MTNEKAKKAEKELNALLNMCEPSPLTKELEDAIKMAIKALDAQPCEDCISREAVLEHICEAKECYKEECKGRTLKRCPDLQWVFDLPPVTPKRPKGKWIEVLEHRDEFGSTWHCECSECRARSYKGFEPLERYCPNCGAYMLGYEDASKKFRTEPSEDCISRQAVIILIDEASEMHPYKVVGDSDTYSNYNQGWSDACDWLYANIEGVPSVIPQIQPNSNEFFNFDAPMVKKSDAVSREAVIKNIKGWFDKIELNPDILIDSIVTLPSVTPSYNSIKTELKPCEDCISRQAVDDAIYDYSRSCDVNYEQIMEFIDKLPPVTPKYTDEEIDKMQEIEQAYVDKMIELAIEESRQKVKPSDSVNRAAVKLDMLKYGFSSPNITITEFVDSLPPVKPKRPKGEWIEYCGGLQCSECGWEVDDEYYLGQRVACPNCGADMSGGGEDET